MTKHQVIDRYGRAVDDDERIVPDGGRLVVSSLTFMDSNLIPTTELPIMTAQTTRHATFNDAQRRAREEMYRAHDERISNAWRNPPTAAVTQAAAQETPVRPAVLPHNATDAAKQREAAYAARCARLENAWKGAQ